jgi:hypothetical protein
MQPEVLAIKKQADAADITQTEIAFLSDRLTRSKICRIFRGYEKATNEELQALEEGLKAAVRAKAKRLSQVVPGLLVSKPVRTKKAD